MNPKILTVYKSPFEKKRLGRDHDGGYVICQIPQKYELLLSAGIDKDTSFEDEWIKIYPDCQCIAFDGTITRCPSQNIEWIRKNIGIKNSETHDDLSSILENKKSVFLKMDIEGHEVDWILHSTHLDNILQIVIEFHHQPFTERHEKAFEKINQTHVLVHMHGNNYSGTVIHEGVKFPVSFECTYLHKSLVSDLKLNDEPLPGPHDKSNNRGSKDIDLNHPPFVHAPQTDMQTV